MGFGLAALVVAAPFVALFGFGLLWLHQQGWLLIWAGAAAFATGLVWSALLWLRRRWQVELRDRAEQPVRPADPDWAPLEQAAWAEVARLSEAVEPTLVTDRDRLLQTAEQTLRAVAGHYHPEHDDPVWAFTLPEALLLSERISARLRRLLLDEVPFSHRIRVGQVLRLWGYKPAVTAGLSYGQRAWRAYRLARLANPLHALAAELRGLFMQELSTTARDYLLRRLGRIWVEEVGRAAIELYSGRLQRDAEALAALAEAEGAEREAALPGRPRVLVVGQPQAGKSALINVLLGEQQAGSDALPLTGDRVGYICGLPGGDEVLLIDTPGLGRKWDVDQLIQTADGVDMVLWVSPAHRADRGPDRAALQALRDHFQAHPERRSPPIRLIASHIDRLSPKREWAPPYRWDPPEERPKAQNIAAAREAMARELELAPGQIIPARLDAVAPYNREQVLAELEALLPVMAQGRRVRLERQPASGRVAEVVRQAARGGRRLLSGALWR
ncbi:GTPase [Alkalilimnicola ehrlichii MLHE-1]|uniref:GTP-binding protein, HSR1-related protein n=1 Tax=Alkalilimnicola ehrlichii (strain ATCC BAA-1101 / DSM 17681 / MLHE-1) TaxID=187272 RepID=Q0A891_ALKEH|nr:GTPase domain-containing protein [Alkalilimnicola ehrlichii]ABI56946.1 GTP-binding protein, HSR1-related protein [Alkalilimnicola ehrlichii MLHE-1]